MEQQSGSHAAAIIAITQQPLGGFHKDFFQEAYQIKKGSESCSNSGFTLVPTPTPSHTHTKFHDPTSDPYVSTYSGLVQQTPLAIGSMGCLFLKQHKFGLLVSPPLLTENIGHTSFVEAHMNLVC